MRPVRLLFALGAALPLLLGGGAARAQAPPPTQVGATVPDGWYWIVAMNGGWPTNMCLDVPNRDRGPINIQLYPLQNPVQENQLWYVQRLSDGFYRIIDYINYPSMLVLDVPNGSTAPGVAIQQYYWNGGDNQRWRFDQYYPPLGGVVFYRIVNKHSGLNLDVPNGDDAVHQSVQQYTPNSGWNQT